MTLPTNRLAASKQEPLSIEVPGWLAPASTLLWHLCELRGLRVVAKKSWALTDDFEAYFTYKGRLFIVYTPMVDVWISLIGQPPDENIFSEVEAHVQCFNSSLYLIAPLAAARFFFKPFNPSREVLEKHGIDATTWSK